MPTHQPDILTDKKERSDFFIALFVILIAGIFITQTSLFTSSSDIESQEALASAAIVDTEDLGTDIKDLSELTHSEEPEVKATTLVHSDTNKTTLSKNVTRHSSSLTQANGEIDYAQETTAIEAVKEVSTEIASEVKEELTASGAEIKENVSDLKTEVQEEIKEVTEAVATSTNNITSNLQATETDTKLEQERQNVLTSAIQESNSKVTDKKDCVIAIGLYREQKNIKVLSNRLELEGYDVFSKPIKSMTQIGVYISCDPVISKSVLSEIREIYAKDAFIVE